MSLSQAKGSNFLRSMSPIPLLYGKSYDTKQATKQLNAKEKKYIAAIERALSAFDSVDEWADYISYLSKLQKALQSNPEPSINHWIPHDFEISQTLSRCLSSKLPSGVHRKALEIYGLIFEIVGVDNLSSDISVWLPGLLPLMSYASISVKPELIELFRTHIVTIDPAVLRVVFKSLLLSFLPALDDTTSESFGSVMDLIELFKKHLNNDSHFWQCLFLCIITSPDKRSGAMEWCVKKLPSFALIDSIEEQSSEEKDDKAEKIAILDHLSPEAKACVTPEAGLLVRAFSDGLKDDNLYVQRGFFDLLVTKLPLNLEVLQSLVPVHDKEILILSAAGAVLRKDMSLNRRLWNWLLGPEQPEVSTPGASAVATSTKSHMSKVEYFHTYGLTHFLNALFSLIDGIAHSTSINQQRIEACKITMAIMDKWEIGQLVVPKILLPIVKCTKQTYDAGEMEEFDDLLKNANTFFDGVETINIWSDISKLIKDHQIDLVTFMLKNFHVEDEDMVVTHAPLILLEVLTYYKGDHESVELIKLLLNLIPQRAFLPIEHAEPRYTNVAELFQDLSEFQSEISSRLDNIVEPPFKVADLSALLLSLVTYVTAKQLNVDSFIFYNFCEILNELLEKIPTGESEWSDQTLINALNLHSFETFDDNDVSVAFGIALIFKTISKQTSKLESLKLLKLVMGMLWNCLIHPTGKYQVEAVKKIWSLELSVDSHYIEAALASLFINSEYAVRIRGFNALWTHSSTFNESDSILTRPLQLILDDLNGGDEIDSILVSKWIRSTLNTSSINRIFKICCSGLLLKNKFIETGAFANNDDDDFALFAYQLGTIQNLLMVDTQLMVAAIKSELCVMDNDTEISIINANNWSVSNYKSLLITIIMRFLSIKSPPDLTIDEFKNYSKCAKISMNLLETLIDGSETNFNQFPTLITQLCTRSTSHDSYSILVTFYLRTLSKITKISSQKQLPVTLLELPSNNVLSNFSDFVETGIQNSTSALVLSAWIGLILETSSFYPELIFKSTLHITQCICTKIEELFSFNKAYINNLIRSDEIEISDPDETISELINGLQDILSTSHSYLNYLLTGKFTNLNGVPNQSNKESSFFVSVMQGVFQVETPNEKSEEFDRRIMVLKSFKSAATTCYKIWLWADEYSKVIQIEEKPSLLSFSQSTNYNASKLKFRSKKILEKIYTMEPLEIIETLISCQKRQNTFNNKFSAFKIMHVLDGSRSQNTLPLLINSLVSRVNISSLDSNQRSSLITSLSEKDVSSFLVDYVESLSNDAVEDIWPQLTQFLKDVQSNPAIYKSLFPDLLKFAAVIGTKVSQISFGDQKKVRKEMIDSFTKILSLSVNVKINLHDESSLTEKSVAMEELCMALGFVIPKIQSIVQDSDKTIQCLTTIISSTIIPLVKYKPLNQAPKYVLKLVTDLSHLPQCPNLKIWKTLCFELLMDSRFFNNEMNLDWNLIFSNWIDGDKEKINDLIVKLLPYGGTSTLFSWNDSELTNRILNLKRISYLIMILPIDSFLNYLKDLQIKIDDMLKNSTNHALKPYIFLLLRVIVTKFTEPHLVTLWPTIYTQLQLFFLEILQQLVEIDSDNNSLNDESKEESSSINLDNALVLQSCKLLDVLVLLKLEEFQLCEWLFVTNTTDAVYRDSNVPILATIDKISHMKSFRVFEPKNNLKVKGSLSDDRLKKPLLNGIKKCDSVFELRDFLDKLSIYNYENDYRMKICDHEVVEHDLFSDLFE
ncbi:hypothetical protein CANARDRAFT_194233 [[Candida] arabinofermentans NRRL YB-2248]|uniref:Uncharacterized protein n=1 Tax=[Candida] arabinofermentans NRRL YB-2248 TaxID=983967 RepID=A0A1E4T6V2_9ASCO|nr:hypothetical protein CANARDRAFT_194233 [[Candida] arabinofermentans NRRL YB-2248]